MYGRFLGDQETGSHIDTFTAQGQRSRQTATISDTAGCQHRYLQRLRGSGKQYQAAHILLARVSGALKAVNANHIHTDALGLQGVTHRHTLVDNLDIVGLETLHKGFRATTGGLNNFHTTVDDGIHVVVIIDFSRHHTDSEVDAEWLISQ